MVVHRGGEESENPQSRSSSSIPNLPPFFLTYSEICQGYRFCMMIPYHGDGGLYLELAGENISVKTDIIQNYNK